MPYYLGNGSPPELKILWARKLRSKTTRHFFVLHIITLCFWKLWYGLKLFLNKNKRAQKLDAESRKRFRRMVLQEQIPPRYFNKFQLQKTENWTKRHNYLYHASLYHLFKFLNNDPDSANILNDKLEFDSFVKGKFNTALLYGYCENSEFTQLTQIWPWETHDDFIIKPKVGSKGTGFVRFTYRANRNGYFSSSEGRLIPTEMIEDYLKFQSVNSKRTFLIQEKVENHSSIALHCNDALAVIRILSLLDTNGNSQLFRPIIQLPQGKSVLSYLHTGAKVFGIDLTTGQLQENIHRPGHREIINLTIPFWEEIISSCVSLHNALGGLQLIGWDIAITREGPTILEGNLQPSMDIHQQEPFEPFVGSEFYELFLYHLQN